MRHISAHDRVAGARSSSRVVERITKAIRTECAFPLELLQIAHGLPRLNHQRKRRCIRRYDQLSIETALQAEVANSKCAVLICKMPVAHCICALTHAPRHAMLASVLDL